MSDDAVSVGGNEAPFEAVEAEAPLDEKAGLKDACGSADGVDAVGLVEGVVEEAPLLAEVEVVENAPLVAFVDAVGLVGEVVENAPLVAGVNAVGLVEAIAEARFETLFRV